MNKRFRDLGWACVGSILALGLAGGAVAGPVFPYESFGGFKDGPDDYHGHNFDQSIVFVSTPFEDFDAYSDDPSPLPFGIHWGINPLDPSMQPFDGKSGVGIRYVPQPAGVEADGDSAEFGTIVHFNRPVHPEDLGDEADEESGMEMTVGWNLKLWNESGDTVVLDVKPEFSLAQWETNNLVDDIADCPRSTAGDYPAHGHIFTSDGQNLTECDDAFTFEPTESDPIQFAYGGRTYRVNVLGFFDVDVDFDADPWPGYTCTTTPTAGGSTSPTFWSPEGQRNAACVRFNVTTLPAQEMFVDIKPTSCPNPIDVGLNPNSGAVLPAAILGTADFDAMLVNPETVELCLDGNCVSPVRYSYEMAAAPYLGEPCVDRNACSTENDEYTDLTLKFGYNDVLDTLGLRGLAADEIRCVTIRAQLYDQTTVEGQDVIWINPANQPNNGAQNLLRRARRN